MSERDDQYNSHPVWSHLDRVDALLHETEDRLSEAGTEAVESHARIRSVSRYSRSLLDRSNPDLVVLSRLANLQNQLQSVVNELDAFNSNGNSQHLVNAANNCDNVLGQVAGLPAVVLSEDVGEIREDIASFRKSAAGYLRGVDSEAKNLRNSLKKSGGRADELAKEIQDQKGRLDQAIAQFQQQSQDTVSKQQTQATESLNQQQAQFSDAQEKRANQFQDELRKATDEMDKAVDKAGQTMDGLVKRVTREAEQLIEGASDKSDDLTAQLEEKLEEARRIVNVVGNVGMTGDYQRNAEAQRKAANRWRWAASGLFVLAAAMVALLLGFFAPAELGVAPTIRRAVIAVVLAAPAYYAAQQSRDHRAFEQRYRSMELELASMNPYLELLPEELQQAVKTELASRYFGGLDGEAPPLVVDSRLDQIRRLRRTPDTATSDSDE